MTHLSRLLLVSASLAMLPACTTTFAQGAQVAPVERQLIRYSNEELDNLVAPVALYADALLAQVLVASTFPDDIGSASIYLRDNGSRGIDDQDWDISVKAVAHYPPVLNLLATQDDWAVALGQAYAAQPDDVMDAVQRLRVMARDQGNLVTTPQQTVTVRRDYIVIEPANPEVIYVPTYEPHYVYSYPVYPYGFFTDRFSFGLGFPVGPWLGYDVDWFARRVYYQGWYAGGWRRYSPGWGIIPVYTYRGPRYVRPNVFVFRRPVNYVNLDRRYRYVRRDVNFVRHDRNWGRNGDRDDDRRWTRSGSGNDDGWRGGDRPDRDDDGPRNGRGNGNDNDGPRNANGNGRGNGNDNDGPRNANGNGRGNGNDNNGPRNGNENGRGNGNGNGDGQPRGNDRDGRREPSFDDIQPGRVVIPRTRPEEPVTRSAVDKVEKPRATPEPGRDARSNGPNVFRGSSGSVPRPVTLPPTTERKSRSTGPVVYRDETRTTAPIGVKRNTRVEAPEVRGTIRTAGGNSRSESGSVNRGGSRAAPVAASQPRPTSGKSAQVQSQRTRVSGGSPAKASSSTKSSGGGDKAAGRSKQRNQQQ